ncbi:MAG: hypothetical protein K0S76_186 [Herbinix sp.]|nr:hypothetical protein [Herbinix sp.]
MNLIQLMKSYDNQPQGTIKLVRHTREKGKDVEQLYKQGLLNAYQSAQGKPVFDTCDYIMTFIATENDKCVFIGMYKVGDKTTVGEIRRTLGLPDLGMQDFYQDDKNYYDLQEIDFMSDLKNRLIISWGNTGIAWHQYLVKKEVIEILPTGYAKEFPGFDDLILSFADLKTIIDNKDANREWHRQLTSVAGVYLILDSVTGSQYIGSAYGKEGILGRWTTYAKTHHGGNQQLIALLEQYPDRYKYFQYSILKILPTALVKDDVLKYETLYKHKLGTRVFGLNSN